MVLVLYLRRGAMEQKVLTQEQLNNLVSFTALLYYYLASEIVQAFGQDGEKAVIRALEKFGQERGAQIRRKVEEEGLPLSLENLARFYDLPIEAAWRTSIRISPRKGTSLVEYCPFAATWHKRNAEKLGSLYCKSEEALIKAYNPAVEYEQKKTLLTGDDKCEVTMTLKDSS